MNIPIADRMNAFQPSIFTELAAYKKRKIAEGADIIDLSLGSPDMSPEPFIMEELAKNVKDGDKYGYSLSGTEEFCRAVSEYYHNTHQVNLNPGDEIIQVMGSQDGLVHVPMVFANPGDTILVPDPGYTAYATGLAVAGANPYYMPLLKEKAFLPDLGSIPEEIARQAKMMILNFPGNPIPAFASERFFKEVVDFARKHHIIVLHDFAYSEFYFEGNKPISFLSIPGAKEVGMEINSLSKSFNLAGARIGYIIGNPQLIQPIKQLKSNLDYGVFHPVQHASVHALLHASEISDKNRQVYKRRRDVLIEGLHAIGWNVEYPEGGMFIWAEIPEGWSSTDFTFALIDKANIVVTPGNAFGPSGEGYVRIALVQGEVKLKQAVENMRTSGIFTSSPERQ